MDVLLAWAEQAHHFAILHESAHHQNGQHVILFCLIFVHAVVLLRDTLVDYCVQLFNRLV